MRIALIQQKATRDKEKNVQRGLRRLEEAASRGADLVCFAELAFEPFYPQWHAPPDVRELAEPVPGPTTSRFAAAAERLNVAVIINLFERAGDETYDTSPVIDKDGAMLGKTRMVHVTQFEYCYEREYYSPGDLGAPVYHTSVGKIGVAICYDRHFPEYMRKLALDGAEVVVVPQAGLVDEWADGLFQAELQVAALQNGYYVALCNRVGEEEHVTFAGESFVCGPDGRLLAEAARLRETTLYADLTMGDVEESPARTLFMRHRRPQVYREWFDESPPG